MIYLDTSAVVPMFVPEPASNTVDAWYESCADSLVSSDWIVTEFASALSIKVRRGEIAEKQANAAWKNFTAFCRAGLRLVPVSRQGFEAAASMARDVASGLRAGDSLHLAMALEVGASGFATADGTLEKNAQVNGLAVNRF
jgi:predicted nucleic acid-binding protein